MKRILTILAVLIVVGAGGTFVYKSLSNASQPLPIQYKIATVATGTVKKTVTATGTLTAWTTVDIKSRAGGKILSLPVTEGQKVKKGDVVAEIDPSDTRLTYNQAQADIDSNKAKVSETRATLSLQETQTQVAIRTAKASLNSSAAAVASARARLAAAKATYNAQTPLTEANIMNAKAALDAAEQRLGQLKDATNIQAYATADANLNQAKANMVNSKAQLERQRALLDKGFVAQSAVDTALASYEVSKATVDNTKTKLDTMKPQIDADVQAQVAQVNQMKAALQTAEANRVQIELKKQDVNTADASLNQSLADQKTAKAKLQEAIAGSSNVIIRGYQIKQALASGERSKAGLLNAEIQLADTHVKAPREGIVLKKYVEEGTIITSGQSFNSSGTSIIQLGDVSRMYVDVQVDESDIANIDIDQKVDVTFDAYQGAPISGKVIKIDPSATVASNVTTVHCRVEVDNTSQIYPLLKPTMNASCEFIINRKEDVLAIPNEAMRSNADGTHYVEVPVGGKVATPDKGLEVDPTLFVDVKPTKVPVEIGLEGNDSTLIKSGLKEGDKIITQTIEPSAVPASGGGQPRMGGGGPGPGRR